MNTLEVFYWAQNGTFLCQFKSKSWTYSFLESILRLSLKCGKLMEHYKQTKVEKLNILIILLLSPKGVFIYHLGPKNSYRLFLESAVIETLPNFATL